MSAVTLTVISALAIADGGETSSDATAEFAVGGANSSVDDIHGDAGARLGAGVAVVERQGALIDAIETP